MKKEKHIRREYLSHLLLSFSDYFLFVPKEYFPSGKPRSCNHFASVNTFRLLTSFFQIGFILLLKEKKRISYVNTVLDFLHDTLILSLKLSNLFFISRDFPNLQQSRQIILPAIYLSFFVQKIIARKNRNCYRKIFHAFSSFFSRCLLL